MSASSDNTLFQQWKSARAKLAQATDEFISASASLRAELLSGSQSSPFGVGNMSESDFASIKSDGIKVENHMAALIQARNSLPSLVVFNRLPQQIKTLIFEFACTSDRRRVNEPDQVYASPLVLAAVCASWRLLALNTRHIWSNIHVVIGAWNGYEAPRVWAERSRGAPIVLTISEYTKAATGADLTEPRMGELCQLLGPILSRTRRLELKLRLYATKLSSKIVYWWDWFNHSFAARDELHVTELWFPPTLAQHRHSLLHITSLTLRGCLFPMKDPIMPPRLVKLHLEDMHKDHRFGLRHLAALAGCPDLVSLAYVNCHIYSTQYNGLIALKKLQILRLESSDGSHQLHHMLRVLDLESDDLAMSLTLSDDAQFISAAHSFFSRTKVTWLFAQHVKDRGSLESLLCPIPSLKELRLDRCSLSGEPFGEFCRKNVQKRGQAWWANLQVLRLTSCWVNANCFLYTMYLHTSLKGVYLFKPKHDNGSQWTDAHVNTANCLLKSRCGPTVSQLLNPPTHGGVLLSRCVF